MDVLLLTPVTSHDTRYLTGLATSIEHSQHLPDDTTLQWHIQGDTDQPEVLHDISVAVHGIHIPVTAAINGRHCGPGITRSIALATHHTGHDVTVSIDADDLFTPTGLADLLAPLHAHPDITWVGGGNTHVSDLHKPRLGFYPPGGDLNGLVAPGQVGAVWRDTGVFPFAAATIAYRPEVILAAGGWPGTPTGQDAALLLAISDTHPGWAVPHAVFEYRKRPGQLTSTEAHTQLRHATHVLMNARSARDRRTLQGID